MSNMNTSQARVVDPILTGIAQGYKHADRVGSILFPTVYVDQRGGKILEFGREGFRLYAARRAPASSTLNISFAYAGKPYELVQDALNSPIPREHIEDASKVPNIDLGTRAINTCMYSLTLTLEDEHSKLATDGANYSNNRKLPLSGSSKWSDPASDPLRDIKDAKEAVRLSSGVDPNKMVISKPIFNALTEHPKIIDRFKYTSSDSITSTMLAKLFDVDTLAVGKAMALSGPEDGGQFTDIWGNNAVLAYVPSAPMGYEEPSFGYTYVLRGHPFVEKPEWENSIKSWVYGVTYERKPVLTGIESGFLFQNVV